MLTKRICGGIRSNMLRITRIALYCYLCLMVSCKTVISPIETPTYAKGLKIIRGFCTGYAVYTEEYGLIFKVSDIFCKDYDTTMGEFLSELIPGRLIIKDGDQYIHIDPEILRGYLEEMGDEGVLEFSQMPLEMH